jgi:hypothetical protein
MEQLHGANDATREQCPFGGATTGALVEVAGQTRNAELTAPASLSASYTRSPGQGEVDRSPKVGMARPARRLPSRGRGA